MINPKITNCKTCAEIPPLLARIECNIFELGLKLYNNIVFSLNLHIDYTAMLDLLNYKRILEYKLVNPDYACNHSVNSIASRVKLLSVNCKSRCTEKVSNEPEPVYLPFFGRSGVSVCIDGFKTITAGVTKQYFKSTAEYQIGTDLYYSDRTRIRFLLILDIEAGLLLTTDEDGKIILIEQNGEVPC